MLRRTLPLICLLLLAGVAVADEVEAIALGQSIWRADTTLRTIDEGGQKRQVRADAFGFALVAETYVRVALRTYGAVGAVLYRAEGQGQAEQRTELATIAPESNVAARLPAGRYLVVVAAQPDNESAYLLTLSEPLLPGQALPASTIAQAGRDEVRATYRLPIEPRQVALSPDGRYAALHDGTAVWLCDLDEAMAWPVALPPGSPRRVAFSPGSWALLVATEQAVRLLALPDLVPLIDYRPTSTEGGQAVAVADADFWNPELGVALLPADGEVVFYEPAPVPAAQLQHVADSAGVALASAAISGWIALRRDDHRFSVIDIDSHQAFGDLTLGTPPRDWAVSPTEPAVAIAGPGFSQQWRAAKGVESYALPDLRAVGFAPDGRLYGADDQGVAQFLNGKPIRLEPDVQVAHLAVSAGRPLRIMAVRADGAAVLWELREYEAPAGESALARARLTYNQALKAFEAGAWAEAQSKFKLAREQLERVPPGSADELDEVACLAWLRSSQASYMLKEWDRSRDEARHLQQLAEALPEGESRGFYVPMSLYRQADAEWEAGRKAEAINLYRQALEAGLSGAAADDARAKTK